MHKIRLLTVLAILFPVSIAAQSLEEFEQWKKQYLGEYKEYKDQIDKEFSEFLSQKWEPFDTEEGKVRDEAPKPVQIPVAKVKPEPKIPQPPVKPVIPPTPPVVVKPKPVFIPVIPPAQFDERVLKVEYLGHQLEIVDGMYSAYSGFDNRVSQKSIQQNFSELAKSDYAKTVGRLNSYKQQLNLNDWAHLQLILQFGEKLALSRNNKRLVSWFLLLKSGLKARLAFDSANIYLLVAAKQNLYDIAYFKFDGEKFYTIPQTKQLPAELFSYNGKYPKALNRPDFSISRTLKSRSNNQYRDLSFKFQGQKYQFKIPVNKNTVSFFSTYPQMDIGEYFHTQLDDVTADALLTQLRPVVRGMPENEAVNFLLSFVQNAFNYKTDNDQFGEENYMFIEETIYYPSSDCEDRSIIFSWLVRNLLKLEVVGLEFPGHVATAVKLKRPVGDVISFQNKKFTIADPTYINAKAGMKMPQYKNTVPKVITR